MNKKIVFSLLILSIIILVVFFKCSCSGKIIGNKSSKVLHFKSCYLVKEIKWKNRVSFSSIDKGVKQGYSVCDKCIDIERKR